MGLRGPLGARSDEIVMGHHRSKASLDAVTKLAKTSKPGWPAPEVWWHDEAKRLYEGLKKSAVADILDHSDIAVAHFLAGQTTRFLNNKDGGNGQMFSAIMSGWQDLLATEAARRRLRIEVSREEPKDEAEDPVKKMMREYAEANNAPAAKTKAA